MLMPVALTMTATSRVPVYLDTPEMDSTVQVSHFTLTFTTMPSKGDRLYVIVTLADSSCIFLHRFNRKKITFMIYL